MYAISVAGGLPAVRDALAALDSWMHLDAEGGARVIRVERLRNAPGLLEALVRVSYKARKRRAWSDLYRFEFQQAGSEVTVVAHHVSGMGRTDPDFLVDLLLRRLALQTAGSPHPDSARVSEP